MRSHACWALRICITVNGARGGEGGGEGGDGGDGGGGDEGGAAKYTSSTGCSATVAQAAVRMPHPLA